MPSYEFKCTTCHEQWEESRTFEQANDPPSFCPTCFNDYTIRVYQVNPIHFKGKGFYATDK